MSYKKRGQAGWTGSKEAKSKNYVERNFAKKEIQQALTEIESGEEYKYPHYSKKVLSKEERKVKQLSWYKRVYGRWTRPNIIRQTEAYDGDGWFSRYVNSLRSKIKELSGDK